MQMRLKISGTIEWFVLYVFFGIYAVFLMGLHLVTLAKEHN
jgi:hypothetical protein